MADKIRTFLVSTAEDVQTAGTLRVPPCYLFYYIDGEGILKRKGLPAVARGGVMGIFDDGSTNWAKADPVRLARDIVGECIRRSFGGVLFDFDESTGAYELLSQLVPALAQRRLVCFAPVGLAGASELTKVVVPSAISGGSFAEMLEHYALRFTPDRLCLELVRVCSDFPMPSYTADGKALSFTQFRDLVEREDPQSYFSEELCAKYFTYQGSDGMHFVLYDDPSTAVQKIRTAQRAGFFAAFMLFRDWGSAATQIIEG